MQSMMIWFVAAAVFFGAWGISDAIQAVAKEMRRANDRCEAEKTGATESGQAKPESKTQ